MTQNFSTLCSDFRLYDLFGDADNLSVTQIWVLEIEREDASELRYLYGRVLPGTYQSNRWTCTSSNKIPLYDKCSVIFHALTLHASAEQLKIFLQSFINGLSFQAANQLTDLTLDDQLKTKIGLVSFGTNPNIRPVMHLPTRDHFPLQTKRLSPTSYASVDSGAVFSKEKPNVFSVPEGCDYKIAKAACEALDSETGMKFASLDAWRLGDMEFICAPSLTSSERCKFEVRLNDDSSSLRLSEPLTREPTAILIVLNTYSDDSVQTSHVARLEKSISYPLDHTFVMDSFKSQVSTAFTLEIYSLGEVGEESHLLLQTGNHFIRGVSLNMLMVEPSNTSVRMDWLNKQVPKRDKAKLEAAGSVARAVRPSRSEIGGHTNDPWFYQNRLVENNVHRLFPEVSTGSFFLTLSTSGGTSRLHLVDWLRDIFALHHDAQIAWFDPFMEDVGINLLHIMGSSDGDYLIITTEKQSQEDSKANRGKPSRIERLLESCEGWNNGYYGNVRLKVLAVPESKIHDRMILIRAADGRPLAGYHLSNSIQRANDNFPLLATPIPLDVLPSVFEFADTIIQSTLYGSEKQAPTANLIFDSKAYSLKVEKIAAGLNYQSSFIDAPRSGDVFAWWLNDQELAGLSGSALLDIMQLKKYVKDSNLDPELFEELPSKFWNDGFLLQDFHSGWDAAGYILACSGSGQLLTNNQAALPSTLKQMLIQHLSPSRVDALPAMIKKSYLDIEHYRIKSFSELLLSTDDPYMVFPYSGSETAWSDYYALKILWLCTPQCLVEWLDNTCSTSINSDHRKRALVVQAFQIICLTLSFDPKVEQIDALLKSSVSIVAWVGTHAIKNAIKNESFDIGILSKLDLIEICGEQQIVLCWLIKESIYDNSNIKSQLIDRLIKSLDGPLTDKQLKCILQSLRSRLGKLHHIKPWILELLLIPMLELKFITAAQVSREWLGELIAQWQLMLKGRSVHFQLDGDGAFTDELAVLMAHISNAEQAYVINEIDRVFNSLSRTIRKPFSAQVSYSSYSQAHHVNLWIYALIKRMSSRVHHDENIKLNRMLEESELLLERQSDAKREIHMNQGLLKYFMKNPEDVRLHYLSTLAVS